MLWLTRQTETGSGSDIEEYRKGLDVGNESGSVGSWVLDLPNSSTQPRLPPMAIRGYDQCVNAISFFSVLS